jgi:hypothetical protein
MYLIIGNLDGVISPKYNLTALFTYYSSIKRENQNDINC